jgi:hypothetical protein
MIADLEVRYTGTDFDNFARTLVAYGHGQRPGSVAG